MLSCVALQAPAVLYQLEEIENRLNRNRAGARENLRLSCRSKVLRYFAFYLLIRKKYHRMRLNKHQVWRKRERTYYTEHSTFVQLYILRSFVYFSQARAIRRKSWIFEIYTRIQLGVEVRLCKLWELENRNLDIAFVAFSKLIMESRGEIS